MAIEEVEGSIAKLQEEVEALEAGIKALDKAVSKATEKKKAESAEYKDLNNNAKEDLLWATNRLNKFYNPKLHKLPPKRNLDEAEQITITFGGTLTAATWGALKAQALGLCRSQQILPCTLSRSQKITTTQW